MALRQIEFIWKVVRPKDEGAPRAIMYAAWKTAIATDPNTTQVLIRTFKDGVWQLDKPHITISAKNPDTAKEQKHQSSHSYTPHMTSVNVVEVKANPNLFHDSGSPAWDDIATKHREIIEEPPSLLGAEEQFITWPSEQTGEPEQN
ncbi:hypothetical protein C8A03DRAFT_19230 [Achaetomium macrosporum]|uniref:Uncharacterized protein n=1 Tax=Achaetomium macrosporum TaxID=79813 RepID=A0AAN7C200_9PEZI|nr:hypothetical protein C8A03DRAFT_19230 [Achaetomium macrosporum]